MALDEQDKQWLRSQFSELDSKIGVVAVRVDGLESGIGKLKSGIEKLESGILKVEGKIDALATRVDGLESRIEKLEASVEKLEASVEKLEASVEKLEASAERLEKRVEELDVKIEKVETSLLTAFHQWASPAEMRQRSHSLAMGALDQEVNSLKDRVSKLEGRTQAGLKNTQNGQFTDLHLIAP